MRNLYYDTVMYSSDSLALLIKTVGADRCLFGTERPGVGTVKDPRTGKWMDETRYLIEAFDWLSDADKKLIFEDNARKLFKLEAGAGVKRTTLGALLICAAVPGWAQLKPITINYPAKAPANWPLFLAKEGGYYQKYGLDARLVFAVHPAGIAMLVSGEAAMTNYPMDQAMQAAMRDGSLVIVGVPQNTGLVRHDDAQRGQERARSEGQEIRRQPTGRPALQFRAGHSGEIWDRAARCGVGAAGDGRERAHCGAGERPRRCDDGAATGVFQAGAAGVQGDRESRGSAGPVCAAGVRFQEERDRGQSEAAGVDDQSAGGGHQAVITTTRRWR